MKHIPIILFALLLLQSCKKDQLIQPSKEMSDTELYQRTLMMGTGGQARTSWMPVIWINTQIGRISGWFLSNQDNYGSSRMDYFELLYSDNFSNDIDQDDKIKIVDSTDNVAIKDPLTKSLLWREEKYYKHENDTIILKSWNYTKGNYYFKFMGSNFPLYPENFTAVLIDKYTGAVVDIPTQNNQTVWYQFNVDEGSKSRDPKRFYIVLREQFIY